jgi:hypothetical protein
MDQIIHQLQDPTNTVEYKLNLITSEVCKLRTETNDSFLTVLLKAKNIQSEVYLKVLDLDCLQIQDTRNFSFLMVAFRYYGINSDCDSNVLLKMLDLECLPTYQTDLLVSSLMIAFRYYGSNPNCDSQVLLKLLGKKIYSIVTSY